MIKFIYKSLICTLVLLAIPSTFGNIVAESFFNPGAEKIQDGIESFQNQDYKQSLDKFQKADEEFGNDPRLEFNKGTTIAKSGDVLKSLPHFQKALDSKDSSLRSKSYFNMGKAYESAQDSKKAIESYRKAIQEDPSNLDARKNLELVYNPKQNKNQPDKSPSKDSSSLKSDSSQNPFSPDSNSKDQNQDKQNQKNQVQEPSPSQNNSNSLTKEEAERLMESLNADRIQRKNSKSITTFRRDKFW